MDDIRAYAEDVSKALDLSILHMGKGGFDLVGDDDKENTTAKESSTANQPPTSTDDSSVSTNQR